MKVVIIGGVAAGTKVAEKFKRENKQDEIVIYKMGKDIYYAVPLRQRGSLLSILRQSL